MKRIQPFLTLVIALFLLNPVFGQMGSIQGIQMTPSNPTDQDTIYFIADVTFPYSACFVEQQSVQATGNTIFAGANHCVGLLAAICYTKDTFMVAPLASGNYDFVFTLTSGAGPQPCTPGVVADDVDTLSFSVDGTTSIADQKQNVVFEVYPNPVNDRFQITTDLRATQLAIYSIDGQLVQRQSFQNDGKELVLSVPTGMYFVQLLNDQQVVGTQRLIVVR